MCQYMIQITQENEDRACYRCEHGTFHLIWGSGVFSLTLKELYTLKGLLLNIRHGETPAEQDRLRIGRLKSARGAEFFELWMANVGILLLSQECQALEKLVSDTLGWVQSQPPFTREGHLKTVQLFTDMVSMPITREALNWN